jgi:hypothetical protein
MIIALLVCLAATVTTGLMGYGEQSKGPLAAVLVTDAKANGKPRALNFPSIKKSAWAAASKLSKLSGFVRLAAGGTRPIARFSAWRDSLRGTGDDRCLAAP